MLFISNNKKIDAVVKELQPRLKLKINVERDFDCGLNDVFEKRPDVVFIQNQIAGVTGESVARHIQLLLGAAAPKFIFIHDGDPKAKPKKGLYEYLIDLSQNEEIVAADILAKLNLLLGPKWQNIFGASLLQGVDYEAYTPPPEPPREPVSSFSFDVVPGVETVDPFPSQSVSPLSLKSEIAPGESFVVISENDGQPAVLMYEACKGGGAGQAAAVADSNSGMAGGGSPEAAAPARNKGQSAVIPEPSARKVTETFIISGNGEIARTEEGEYPPGAIKAPQPDKKQPPPHKPQITDQEPLVAAALTLAAGKPATDTGAVSEGSTKDLPQAKAQEKPEWVFDGEPNFKKSTWKWYQVVELLLVVCLLLGGWYLYKQKSKPAEPAANEVNLLQSAATSAKMPAAAPGGEQPLPAALPAFIPAAGHDPAFAAQNPGWQRYLGEGLEFRLFRENGRLKAVQVKADKGRVISDALLKTVLAEFTGANEYKVKSRENKLGFLVSTATVADKAEMLIYTKNRAVHAVVVALN